MAENRRIYVWNDRFAGLTGKQRWKTGLLILSSAALGGIAVALWNRKSLSAFRELESHPEVEAEERAKPVSPDDIY